MKPLATILSRRFFAALLTAAILPQLAINQAYAKGQGPISVWPASDRYVLIADKSYPGLVLVDLVTGAAVERLKIPGKQPKGVSSCPGCDFILITGASGDFWLMQLEASVEQLLVKEGKLGLETAALEPLELYTKEGRVADGRMCIVSDDGKYAFVASSDDNSVFKVDFDAKPNATRFLHSEKDEPFGLNWGENGSLLVSMHKRYVWRMSLDGKREALYDIKKAGCPGVKQFKPNLRAAVDDPLSENSVLILASNPKSYDAAVWRLSVDEDGTQTCAYAAAEIGRDPGWVDDAGTAIVFSRPHYFTPRPNSEKPQIIVPDIDNRALRLLDLETMTASSVMYNRDLRLEELPAGERTSVAACGELSWKQSVATTAPSGNHSCARPPEEAAMRLNLEQAQAHCKSEGARLCEPTELRVSGVAAGVTAWTRADCASCWLREAEEKCPAVSTTHKTEGIVHGNPAFSQSWNSGHALEVSNASTGESATLCRPYDETLKAAAPCCADGG